MPRSPASKNNQIYIEDVCALNCARSKWGSLPLDASIDAMRVWLGLLGERCVAWSCISPHQHKKSLRAHSNCVDITGYKFSNDFDPRDVSHFLLKPSTADTAHRKQHLRPGSSKHARQTAHSRVCRPSSANKNE